MSTPVASSHGDGVPRLLAPLGGARRLLKALWGALLVAAPLLALGLVVWLFLDPTYERVTIIFLINLIAVVGTGVYTGNTGVLSFGHVAFMGLGAYAAGLLTVKPQVKNIALPELPELLASAHMDLLPALLVALVLVALIALVMGLPISRLGGAAGAIATLGILVIVHVVLNGATDFTRGSQTFYGVPRSTTLPLALAVALVVVVVARLFRESVYGLQLRASREDELAARAMGVDVPRRRLAAWVLSAVLLAAAGVLFGHFLGAFSPKDFYFTLMFSVLAMLIVGGMTTVSGAVVGTALVMVLIEGLRRLETGPVVGPVDLPQIFGLTEVGLAAAILAVMYRRPEGLLGYLELDELLALRRAEPDVGPPVTPREAPSRAPGGGAGSLDVQGVSKAFAGVQALDGVSLRVAPGEIVGLIGPNGSGKTTLLNVISGTLAPGAGRVSFGGTDVTRWPPERIARAGIGRTFQNIRLFGHLSVLDNVATGVAAQSGTGRGDIEQAARSLLAELGVGVDPRRMAGTLPYGVQRQVEIARALALSPRYLLLDEPAAGMNLAESDQLMTTLSEVRERRGLGLLVVDHDLRLIMQLCDRIVVLNKGEVIAAGLPEEIQEEPRVIEAYLGTKRRTRQTERRNPCTSGS